MQKYEEKLNEDETMDGLGRKDLYISKWRSERNFYLHCFAVSLMLITWGIQHIIYSNSKMEEFLAVPAQKKPKIESISSAPKKETGSSTKKPKID